MREGLDQWSFVIAAYAIGLAGTLATAAWSWLAMRRAEARGKARGKAQGNAQGKAQGKAAREGQGRQ